MRGSARGAHDARRRCRAVPVTRATHRSRVAARLRADRCASRRRQRGARTLGLRRVEQVRQLCARRACAGGDLAGDCAPARGSDASRQRAAPDARRRRHRDRWTRHDAGDRRVVVVGCAGAQSGLHARRLRARLSHPPRHHAHHLARRRVRGRRHARARGRHRALRVARRGGVGARSRSHRRESRALARQPAPAAAREGCPWPTDPGGDAAVSARRHHGWHAPAGQLRKFLYGERRVPCAHV